MYCPVCTDFTKTGFVFGCSHATCETCFELMVDTYRNNLRGCLRCPLCRSDICSSDVTHVDPEVERQSKFAAKMSGAVMALKNVFKGQTADGKCGQVLRRLKEAEEAKKAAVEFVRERNKAALRGQPSQQHASHRLRNFRGVV